MLGVRGVDLGGVRGKGGATPGKLGPRMLQAAVVLLARG